MITLANSSVGISINDAANNVTIGNVMGNPSYPAPPSGPGEARASKEIILATLFFRVSKYDRFENKLDASTRVNNEVIINGEGFDDFEVNKGYIDVAIEKNTWLDGYYNSMYRFTYPVKITTTSCTLQYTPSITIPGENEAFDNLNNTVGISKTSSPAISEALFANGIATSTQIAKIDNLINNAVKDHFDGLVRNIKAGLPSCMTSNGIFITPTSFEPTFIKTIYDSTFNALPAGLLKANVYYAIPGVGTTTTKKITF